MATEYKGTLAKFESDTTQNNAYAPSTVAGHVQVYASGSTTASRLYSVDGAGTKSTLLASTDDFSDSFADVSITTPADASFLIYDTGTSTWRDYALSSAITCTDAGVVSLAADGIGASEIRLENNAYLTARNQADGGDLNVIKANASDLLELGLPTTVNGDVTVLDTNALLTLQSSVDEDTDDGREVQIVFRGTNTSAFDQAEIRVDHDGSADDKKGKISFKVNDGNDADGALQEAILISSGLKTEFFGEISGSGNLNVEGSATIEGDLTVRGVTTTVDSTTLTIADDLITVSKGNDTVANANGSGMEIDVTSGTNLYWKYVHANTALSTNVDIDAATGKAYKIAGTSVLNATTLGGAVVASSLTSVGALTGLTLGGDLVMTAAARDFDLIDNTANALTFDAGAGGTSVVAINTTNAKESVVFQAALDCDATFTGEQNQDVAAVTIAPTGITTPASSTNAVVASLYIEEPAITKGDAITKAATVYIANAPTEGTNNYALYVDAGNVLVDAAIEAGGNITSGGSFIIGSADMNEADLEKLDGITNGAGAANKCLVLDASADITGGPRNITITGELNAATGDFSGNIDVAGTANLDVVDIDGAVQIDATVTVGVDGTGHDFTCYGDSANELLVYTAADNTLKITDAAGVAIVTMGGDANGEYAVLVQNQADESGRVKANAFVTYSARHLKKDIEPMGDALQKLNKLQPVTYNWKHYDVKSKGWEAQEIGFIADEVHKVVPQVVQTDKSGAPTGIDYSKLTALLTEAVKQQDQEIKTLKATLSTVLGSQELLLEKLGIKK